MNHGMSTWLNYHHLYYFRTIAQEGSIARAAEKLKLGQPTLSAQLKLFEESLGFPLFDRQHKKLTLNESGRMALQYANEIFKLGSEMLEVLEDRISTKKPHVQIGCLDSVPKTLTLKVIKSAFAIGECTVSLLEGKSDELLRELALHRIDLFISDFAPSGTEWGQVHSRPIAKVPVDIYADNSFKHLRRGFPFSLAGQPMVLPTIHSKLRSDLEHYFNGNGIHFNVVAETQDTSLQKLMGCEGLGLIPLNSFAAAGYLQSGELCELGRLPGIFQEYFFVAASRRIENPISGKLMKTFQF